MNKHKQNGGFLIELMIGLLMSIVSVLGVMTIYSQFEAQKRTTTEVGQALTNGALALFPLEHYTKMAGFGFNSATNLGCTVLAYNVDTGTDYTFTLSPVIINAGASNKDSDSITILFGNSENYFTSSQTTQLTATAVSPFKVDARFGYNLGDVIIASNPGLNCTMSQISSLPNTSGNTDSINRLNTSYIDPYLGTSKTIKYNKPGGSGVLYPTGSKIFNLGNNPSMFVYSINNNQLQQNDRFDNTDNITILGDNIMIMKALYGIDTDNNGAVDSWTNVTPPTAQMSRITVVRVGLLARSSLRERREGGLCTVTTNSNINWLGGTFDISDLPDWGCYRYRVIQTTIPLKNMIWRNN